MSTARKAGLMRGQRSFWVKYLAWGLHVKHKKRDRTMSDMINNAGLIRTNTDARDQPYLRSAKGTKRIY